MIIMPAGNGGHGSAYAVDTKSAALLVARAHPHGLPQVRMLKLLWLAELRHYERTSQRLTPAGWWRWDYGPYSKDVVNTIKRSTRAFRLEKVVEAPFPSALMIHASESVTAPLDLPAADALKETLWLYEKYTDRELLEEIYADPFFEETPYSHDFDFSQLGKYRPSLPADEVRRLIHLPTKPVAGIAELFTP